MGWRVPVLTYHSANIAGNDYAGNDLVAFSEDLERIHRDGWRVVSLHTVVDVLRGASTRSLERCVALSVDDGVRLDWQSLTHPRHGPQRSLAERMDDFVRRQGPGAQPELSLTAFVIAAPHARAILDRARLFGLDWLGDAWWPQAQNSGRFRIENHSWDHNHDAIPGPGLLGMARGGFHAVDRADRAVAQILAAKDFLDRRLRPAASTLFAYPYGHVNDYLQREWLPTVGAAHGIDAAFTTDPAPISAGADRYALPRYVCGAHWRSPDELGAILRD
jgi:peptidoglycan/xylan/chitin deacetylase (PgdA/CDA1 family)